MITRKELIKFLESLTVDEFAILIEIVEEMFEEETMNLTKTNDECQDDL